MEEIYLPRTCQRPNILNIPKVLIDQYKKEQNSNFKNGQKTCIHCSNKNKYNF